MSILILDSSMTLVSSLNHVIVGSDVPFARHCRVALLLGETVLF